MIHILTGPPCGGKTHHARNHAGPRDIVLDTDALAVALGHPNPQPAYDDDHPAKLAANLARFALLKPLLSGELAAPEVWIIDTRPSSTMRRWYAQVGAEVLELNPGMATCLERAELRPDPSAAAAAVRRFFEATL